MTGDYTPDLMALLSADIIISTPEKWDGISRNWHSRSYVTKVHHAWCSSIFYKIVIFIFCFLPRTVFSLSNSKCLCWSIGWTYDFGWDSLTGGWPWTHPWGSKCCYLFVTVLYVTPNNNIILWVHLWFETLVIVWTPTASMFLICRIAIFYLFGVLT